MSQRSELVYQIAKWTETYETADSKRHKTLTWVSVPVGFDSNGYQLLIEQHPDDAAQIYGAWCALVSIAARCPVRGVLANSKGIAMTPERCARMAYMDAEPFKKMFSWASSPDVGWLEATPPNDEQTTADQSTNDSQPVTNQPSTSRQPVTKRQPTSQQTESVVLPNLTQPNLTQPENPLTPAGDFEIEELRKPLGDWLDYKKERREAYKPTGLKALLSRTVTLAGEFGATAVANAIQVAMASGWKGFEHTLNKNTNRGSPPMANKASNNMTIAEDYVRRNGGAT